MSRHTMVRYAVMIIAVVAGVTIGKHRSFAVGLLVAVVLGLVAGGIRRFIARRRTDGA